jgi:hypothetical protein
MISYRCERCFYKSDKYPSIIKHILIKKQCSKQIESYKYSDDQLLILSLLPHYDNKSSVNEDDLNKYEKTDVLFKNKLELINIVKNINKNNLKTCILCNEEFKKIDDLRRHIILSCFFNDKNNKIQNNMINSNNITTINSNNVTNITNNITNNINVKIDPPIPFSEDWDVSDISKNEKIFYLFQNSIYTSFLEKILQNKNNLNVIIENINNEYGLIYKDHIDKYKEIKTEDIVFQTMEKLRNIILKINDECIKDCVKNCFNECFNEKLKESFNNNDLFIRKKYTDYRLNNNEIKNFVEQNISYIYTKNKDEAIEKLKLLEKNGY